jgi:hypothetical protein
MPKLEHLSDDELDKLYQQSLSKPKLENLSDDELDRLYQGSLQKKSGPGVGERLGKGVIGGTVGVAEAINPLNIPHNLEILGRAPFQDVNQNASLFDRISERFQKAEKSSITPDIGINKVIAPALRAPFTRREGQSLSDAFKSEQASQNEFNSGDIKTGNELAQLGMGVYGLAGLIKGAVKAAPKLAGFAERAVKTVGSKAEEAIKSLSNVSENAVLNAKDPSKLTKAKLLLDKIAGNLPDEVSKAIFERTENVKHLMNNPEKASVMDTVQTIRKNIDDTENLIGSAVGEYKNFLRGKNDIRLDNSPLIDLINSMGNRTRLSGGENIDPADIASLGKYYKLIQNPTKAQKLPRNYITVGDTVKIIDQLDNDLQPFYHGTDTGPRMQNLSALRRAMDAGLEDKFPAFKETKVLYKQFQDNASLIRQKIDSTGAESFLANIYGANKTENRTLLKSLIDQGQESAQSLKNLSRSVKSGDRLNNMRFDKITNTIESAAENVKTKTGQEFLDQIAEKVAARRLNNFGDKDADQLDRLIRDYSKAYEAIGQTVGGAAGAVLGAGMMGAPGAGVGTLAIGSAGKSLGGLYGTVKGKQLFNIDRVLNLIEESKEAPTGLRNIAKNIRFIAQKFDKNMAQKFFDSLPLDRSTLDIITKTGAIVNPIPQLEQTIEFLEPSVITPRRK